MNSAFLQLTVVERLIIGAYFGVLLLLAVYGVHRLFIVALYRRSRADAPRDLHALSDWPRVTVQLPLFNEMYVAERLLEAAAALDYPAGRLDIQALDDSTDETRDIVARKVRELRGRGVDIHHLCRTDRVGFKAGALAAGLERATGEFICVFDADFVPAPDMLRQTIPHFAAAEVGMVQARWEHLNRDYSLLSRAQALQLDAHFAVEHAARNRTGRFFNFNGTAGVWRRSAIEDAGNWQHDTLTEDLDLSYRAQIRGWRFVYLNAAEAPAELPVQVSGLKSQRHRWTKGAVQTARKLLRSVWTSPAPLRAKVEATFHLTANINYPLNLALAALIFPAMMIRMRSGFGGFFLIDVPVFLCGTLSVYAYYLFAQRELGRFDAGSLRSLAGLILMETGLGLNNTVAVFEGFRRDPGEFVRTPKFSLRAGSEGRAGKLRGDRQSWVGKLYRGRDGWLCWLELAIGVYFGVAGLIALQLRMWPAVPFLLLYQLGYLYIGGLTLSQRYRRRGVPAVEAPA